VIRAVGKNAPRPIVFALSNPTSSSEAQPADILAWTEGRAIVATGSPFEPVEYGGKKHFIGQGNNAFIFPGLGFGAILAQTTEITDGMVMAASQGLSDYTAEHHLSAGLVYPPVQELREVAAHVAARVIAQAFQDGVARSAKVAPENALAYVRSKMWQAKYLPVVKA
jgi:malate dehydrogenase (oxaloacetate-decarboxylating)